MTKKIIWLVCGLLVAGAAFWWLRDSTQLGDQPREGTSEAARIPSASEAVEADGPHVSAGAPVGVPTALLGGPNLNLQRVYREGLAARGSDDQLLASVIDFSRVICSIPYPEEDAGWKDPNRKWAMEYIKNACADFNSDDYRYTGVNRNALWYMAKVGEKEAADAAMKDIHRSDNMLEVGVASVFLVERGLFPEQQTYDLEKDQMLKIALMAGKLRTCGAVGACGAESLITAELCARVGCRPGTSYADAVRRDLSPREYEAMLKMRDAMAKL
jgi:hypothetical protein